jgi:hypothetical protein
MQILLISPRLLPKWQSHTTGHHVSQCRNCQFMVIFGTDMVGLTEIEIPRNFKIIIDDSSH